MLRSVLKRVAAKGHTWKSSPILKRCGGVNLRDCISLAHWWDEVFEAADLVKVVNRTKPCHVDGETVVSDKDHCNIEADGGENTSASGVWSVPSYSSTSSASLDPWDCSEKQTAFEVDTCHVLYPSRLKILAAKIALNSGKEHLSSSGQVRKARLLRNPCHSECKRCQVPRLTLDERLTLLDHFWSLNSHEKQWMFISNAVSVSRPKRKFAVHGSKGEKSCSREYYLNIDGRKRKVFKTMFKHT